jgi:hypothetical protein
MSIYGVDPGSGPKLSMMGCAEYEIVVGGGIICEWKVLMRWRIKAGFRMIAGMR